MSKFPLLSLALLLSACATRPIAVVEAPPPPPPAPTPPPMPAGAVPGLTIPARLADGRYPTPSRGVLPGTALSADGAAWHLRGALNVAALACRDDALVAGYNGFLTARRAELVGIEARYAAEWKAGAPGDWRDAYDDAMTRLYNFYGQSLARPGFCAAATTLLADLAAASATPLAPVATERLATLDAPFTDFFAAYDAWRTGRAASPAAVTPAPVMALAAPVPVVPVAAAKPVLTVDPAVFAMP